MEVGVEVEVEVEAAEGLDVDAAEGAAKVKVEVAQSPRSARVTTQSWPGSAASEKTSREGCPDRQARLGIRRGEARHRTQRRAPTAGDDGRLEGRLGPVPGAGVRVGGDGLGRREGQEQVGVGSSWSEWLWSSVGAVEGVVPELVRCGEPLGGAAVAGPAEELVDGGPGQT